mgnify:CR=1 FL=1
MSKEEDIQRTLVAEFSPLTINTDTDGDVTVIAGSDWTNLSATGAALLFQETQIDLSGYALQKKSFYPHSSFEQRNAPTVGTYQSGDRNIYDTIIVSSVPLTKTQSALGTIVQSLPGFTQYDLAATPGLPEAFRLNRDVLMHQHQLISSHDTTTATVSGNSIYRITSDLYASSLEPTAADVLYCYRIVFSNGMRGNAFLPAARVLIPGTIAKEPTLEYMMRLKRSYELANQV